MIRMIYVNKKMIIIHYDIWTMYFAQNVQDENETYIYAIFIS